VSIKYKRIVIDAREFSSPKITGISRVLIGLIEAVNSNQIIDEIILATSSQHYIPQHFCNTRKIKIAKLPNGFLSADKILSSITKKNVSLYISPYPKLPLFKVFCPAIHIIHDVFYITRSQYSNNFKRLFNIYRLKKALNSASITWYDSNWSMKATKELIHFNGINPRIRYPSIGEQFNINSFKKKDLILGKYKLQSGYIIVNGNGRPHKNLGVLLKKANRFKRMIVFIGVSSKLQNIWKKKFPMADVRWLDYVDDQDLPFIYKGAFCLAQPSKEEGFGYPPLEAMACGTPTVVSNIPVLVETTGGNTIMADPEDPDSWIEAFEKLENRSIYSSNAEKGLLWVQAFIGNKGNKKQLSDINEIIENN
jgi:glycosyltransferase involved in cell wall biosynthesis